MTATEASGVPCDESWLGVVSCDGPECVVVDRVDEIARYVAVILWSGGDALVVSCMGVKE